MCVSALQDQTDEKRQRCQGMYSQQAWGGAVDPFILLKFIPYVGDEDPVVSLVIFEWKDEDLIGVYESADATQVRGNRREKEKRSRNTYIVDRKLAFARRGLLRQDFATQTTSESSFYPQTPRRSPKT